MLGSPEAAERSLQLATERSASVPADRRGHVQVMIAVMRLLLARLRGDLPAVAEEVRRLLEPAGAPAAAQLGAGEELRAVALISLGVTEFVTARFDDAERHLEQARALGHRIGRPFLEFRGLAQWAMVASVRSFAPAADRGMQAVEMARTHGWPSPPSSGVAFLAPGPALGWRA